jgi:transposase InsO family protein
MRDNSYDRTIERNYLQKWRFLIPEYEAVKAGRSGAFRRVGDFYRHHGTCSQTFRKYYNRYLRSGAEADLLPQRRGPKWRERREPEGIEAEIVACRQRGMNRYEIYAALRERRTTLPSPSTIYRVLKRYHLNRRTPAMREEKRRIIKDKLGELGHVDLHQLPRDMFLAPPSATAYVVSLIDSCSRLAWAEVISSKRALPVMFRTLKIINTLNATYGLVFAEILSDNGSEFASRNNPQEHPFEAMLIELDIKHRYTRPYRPQTNGKIERFWRTLDDDVIEGATFDNLDHFCQ